MKNKNYKTAFSLIELSIVAVIISVLVSTIIVANRLSDNAKLAAATTLTYSSPVKDIDGLVMWLETTMPKSFVDAEADNNKTISTWYDLSPNRNNATDLTSGTITDQPTYITNTINGLPVLRFDGTNDFLNWDGTDLVNSNYTFFVVEQRRVGVRTRFIGDAIYESLPNGRLSLGYSDSTTLAFDQSNNAFYITVSQYTSPIPVVHSFVFNSAIGKKYYSNGTNLGSLLDTNGRTGLVANHNPTIGSSPLDSTTQTYYNGDIAEIIVFSKALTDQEREDVERYLGKKWGMEIALDNPSTLGCNNASSIPVTNGGSWSSNSAIHGGSVTPVCSYGTGSGSLSCSNGTWSGSGSCPITSCSGANSFFVIYSEARNGTNSWSADTAINGGTVTANCAHGGGGTLTCNNTVWSGSASCNCKPVNHWCTTQYNINYIMPSASPNNCSLLKYTDTNGNPAYTEFEEYNKCCGNGQWKYVTYYNRECATPQISPKTSTNTPYNKTAQAQCTAEPNC